MWGCSVEGEGYSVVGEDIRTLPPPTPAGDPGESGCGVGWGEGGGYSVVGGRVQCGGGRHQDSASTHSGG